MTNTRGQIGTHRAHNNMDNNILTMGRTRRQIHTRRIQTNLGRHIGTHRAHKIMDKSRRKMVKPRRQIHTRRSQTNIGKDIMKRNNIKL
eukprot:10373034-Heterocapsa_arctica.AAC.1